MANARGASDRETRTIAAKILRDIDSSLRSIQPAAPPSGRRETRLHEGSLKRVLRGGKYGTHHPNKDGRTNGRHPLRNWSTKAHDWPWFLTFFEDEGSNAYRLSHPVPGLDFRGPAVRAVGERTGGLDRDPPRRCRGRAPDPPAMEGRGRLRPRPSSARARGPRLGFGGPRGRPYPAVDQPAASARRGGDRPRRQCGRSPRGAPLLGAAHPRSAGPDLPYPGRPGAAARRSTPGESPLLRPRLSPRAHRRAALPAQHRGPQGPDLRWRRRRDLHRADRGAGAAPPRARPAVRPRAPGLVRQ